MQADVGFWVLQGLNALQLSMLLFLLSVGLTVIFGLMHFVNLAHGALYALGAFGAGQTCRASTSATRQRCGRGRSMCCVSPCARRATRRAPTTPSGFMRLPGLHARLMSRCALPHRCGGG